MPSKWLNFVTWRRLLSAFWTLVILRCCFACAQIFLPLDQPHVWRQTDTIGVALRWVRRFTVESGDSHPLWLPAVLNSARANGIMPMEFPFFNALLTLGFWGHDFPTGLAGVKAVALVWHILLGFWVYHSWKGEQWERLDISKSFLLMPFVGLLALFITKLIPDITALFFCLISLAYLLRAPKPATVILAIVTGALGLLIKPTAVPAFLLGLLFLPTSHPIAWLRTRIFIGLAIVVPTLLFYTIGTHWIDSFREGSPLFLAAFRNPIETLASIATHPVEALQFIFDGLAFVGFPFLILAAGGFQKTQRALHRLLSILAAQIVMIWILDGHHSFAHQYYQLATAPTVCLLVSWCIRALRENWANVPAWRRTITILCALAWIGSYGDRNSFEVRSLWITPKKAAMLKPDMCASLKQRLPGWPWDKGYVFRTEWEFYPQIGLCFGERTNAKTGKFAIYTVNQMVPEACRVIAKSDELFMADCRSL